MLRPFAAGATSLALLGLLALACGSSDATSEPSSPGAEIDGGPQGQPSTSTGDGAAPPVDAPSRGAAQKGPFAEGSIVRACAMNADGSPDASRCKEGLVDAQGRFDLAVLPWAGPTLVTASGRTFDEVKGAMSPSTLVLAAVVDAHVSAKTNVNLFTNLEAARVRALLAAGAAFADARTRALQDLALELGIATAPSELEFFPAGGTRSGDDSSLLLFSILASQEELAQADLDALASDFGDDGVFNGAGKSTFEALGELLEDDATAALVETARQNLATSYGPVAAFQAPLGKLAWADPCLVASWADPRLLCANVGRDLLLPGGSTVFRFEATHAGMHVFTVSQVACATLTWTAAVAGSAAGAAAKAGGTTFAEGRVTLRQSAGESVTLTVNNTCAAEDAYLRVLRITDGSPASPRVVPPGKTLRSTIGAWAGTNATDTAYYAVPVAPGQRQVLLTDFAVGAQNPGMTVSLFDGTLASSAADFAQPAIATSLASGKTSVTLGATFTKSTMLVRVKNANAKTSVQFTGDDASIDYLSVTPLSAP
jgi:hypothetical protein